MSEKSIARETQLESLSAVLKVVRAQSAEHGSDAVQFGDQEFTPGSLSFTFRSPSGVWYIPLTRVKRDLERLCALGGDTEPLTMTAVIFALRASVDEAIAEGHEKYLKRILH